MPKLKFEVTIPQKVLDVYNAVAYQIRKWKFIIKPYRCERCMKSMHVKQPEYEYQAEGRHRIIVGNLQRDGITCRECLVTELTFKQWTPRFSRLFKDQPSSRRYNYRFWSSKKCSCCNEKVRSFKDVEILPSVDMTFCGIAWNYDRFCKRCIIDTVKYGKIRTSRWGIWKKSKMAPMNDKNLFIGEDGRVL